MSNTKPLQHYLLAIIADLDLHVSMYSHNITYKLPAAVNNAWLEEDSRDLDIHVSLLAL